MDIFDHILAVVPEFKLSVFQVPSGYDFQNIKIGVYGLGEIGNVVACDLSKLGFEVLGWSRTKKLTNIYTKKDLKKENRVGDHIWYVSNMK